MEGTLYIIAAASGTGKTSLAQALAEKLNDVLVSVSHTTRPLRYGERLDKSYYFLEEREFTALIEQDFFLEYAKVYDYYYGTSREQVTEILAEGKDLILDIDWQGARLIKKQLACKTIFLLPPSRSELRCRLERRGRETQAVIDQRMTKAIFEMEHYKEFDYLLINDNFETTLSELVSIVLANRYLLEKQEARCKKVINDLLLDK